MSLSDNDPWSYETDGNVLVCDQRGWSDGTVEEIHRLMEQFEELAAPSEITATMTLVDPDIKLDGETQDLIEQNAPVYERLGIRKVALVADRKLTGMALESLSDPSPDVSLQTFTDQDDARAWCEE